MLYYFVFLGGGVSMFIYPNSITNHENKFAIFARSRLIFLFLRVHFFKIQKNFFFNNFVKIYLIHIIFFLKLKKSFVSPTVDNLNFRTIFRE